MMSQGLKRVKFLPSEFGLCHILTITQKLLLIISLHNLSSPGPPKRSLYWRMSVRIGCGNDFSQIDGIDKSAFAHEFDN